MDVVTLGMAKAADVDFRGQKLRTFDPRRDLSNCRVWLDASTLTGANGSNVSTWSDQSGYGNDVYQATVAAQPTLTTNNLNGKNTLHTTAAGFMLRADTLFGAGWGQPATYPQPNTLIAVAKVPSGARGGNSVLFGSAPSGIQHILIDSNGSPLVFAGSGSSAGGPNINDGQWHIMAAVFDVSSWSIYLDGYLVSAGATQGQGAGAMKGIGVGADAGGSSKLGAADIAELIMCADRLSPKRILHATQALATKWGL